ncbi:unnamed protein product [Acanthoscelides obtectus]|uniref:Uncharacterized protein n=1 Tax=Acanthoscelides obtectus TaxID=200917 RepID=A0A9P0NXZ5_ACAOB|nr:unnamed protein product [Acanthoscelides obtectus]CAK1666067.1 hypothetical protein AOBTE_LOCUS25140 [Acanthoscelides obtectus]
MRSNQFSKHLFHSFAGRSKTGFLNASTASSGDWNLDHSVFNFRESKEIVRT